jgi:Tn3 transposase DDE domain
MYPGGLPVSRELATRKVRAATRFVAESCTPYFDTGDLAPGTSSRSASWSSGWSPARPSSTTASARSVRDQLRDPVGALGLVVNAIVLWNTRYVHAALNHPCGSGYHVRNDDMQRPSPLVHDHINLRGRYQLSASNLPMARFDRCATPSLKTCDRHPGRYRRILLHCC